MMYGFSWIYAAGHLKIISCKILGGGLDSMTFSFVRQLVIRGSLSSQAACGKLIKNKVYVKGETGCVQIG